MKLELQPEVNVKIFLDDGTEIDDDDTLQACEAGTVFHFVPDSEHWSPSVSTTDNSTVKVVNNTASVLQISVFSPKGILVCNFIELFVCNIAIVYFLLMTCYTVHVYQLKIDIVLCS